MLLSSCLHEFRFAFLSSDHFAVEGCNVQSVATRWRLQRTLVGPCDQAARVEFWSSLWFAFAGKGRIPNRQVVPSLQAWTPPGGGLFWSPFNGNEGVPYLATTFTDFLLQPRPNVRHPQENAPQGGIWEDDTQWEDD